jgi:hypothetical protein
MCARNLIRSLSCLGMLVLLGGICACGGATMSNNIVEESSQDFGLDRSSLTVQAANNVRVYDAIPTEPYMLLETRDSYFDYPLNSVTYMKIEKKKHLAELRDWAGRSGANGVIVMISDKTQDLGGVGRTNVDDAAPHTVVQSSDETRQYVRAFAIYLP